MAVVIQARPSPYRCECERDVTNVVRRAKEKSPERTRIRQVRSQMSRYPGPTGGVNPERRNSQVVAQVVRSLGKENAFW